MNSHQQENEARTPSCLKLLSARPSFHVCAPGTQRFSPCWYELEEWPAVPGECMSHSEERAHENLATPIRGCR